MTLIKVPWYVLRVKVGILDHPQMPGIHAHGKAKPRYVKYIIRQGKAKLRLLELTSVFHHLPSVGYKQLWALAHLGCTREAYTS